MLSRTPSPLTPPLTADISPAVASDPHPPATAESTPETHQRSRADINRANAQKSTGPRSPRGKAASKYNALQHGLCAQSIIMEPEEAAVFEAFHRKLAADLRIHGALEESLVQNMANAQYQIERARAIENNILQIGAIDFAADHEADFETKNLAHTVGLVESFKANAKYLDLISRYTPRHTRKYLQLQARLREAQRNRLQSERLRHEQKKQRHNQDFANYQQAAVGRTTTSDRSRSGRQHSQNQSHKNQSGFVPQSPMQTPSSVPIESKLIGEVTADARKSEEKVAA